MARDRPARTLFLMPTYIYETISETPERFELRQGFNDPVLTTHPETGTPVRRVIAGGLAIMANGHASADRPDSGCGPDTCQCGRFN
jgi:predicted nucleic acid-binding Zn ribbon protein